ncbi:hypothetical protein [Budvicia aquatica]|uniref:Uncharacterized protein n=2 Tax=Budvicia aquatica TaxID=82979 RepID=A0A2C6DR72_9GAMM|nr:hypothetical protein [Budvicia aquatica]PHI31203.1 hypothetical protein CRN84_18590 [Budvicia aquatica]
MINQMQLVAAIMKELSRQVPGLPAEARYVNAAIAAANSICNELSKPIVKASNRMGLSAWLTSDDTGLSSKFMASVLSGQFITENRYPLDPADFGRCVRLIRAVPELEPSLSQMRDFGKEWAAVVNNWSYWTQLYDNKQGEELYKEMKTAYSAAPVPEDYQ